MGKNLIEMVIAEIPRVLDFVDKKRGSDTYGCCYYPFWRGGNDPLIENPIFVNARWQEIAYTLALLYNKNYPKNPYYHDKEILELIKIIVSYWVKIQYKDGSFSEWSIYEHGQPPTAFGLFAMIEVYKIIKNSLSQNEDEKIRKCFIKAADWLCKNVDKNAINHECVAVASLYSAYLLFNRKRYLDVIREKIAVISEFQSDEGWLKEIDGLDSGYNMLSLAYLGLYWKMSGDNSILPIAEKIMEINKFFVYPDGTHGGGFNSRFASASWTLGYLLFSKNFDLARSLSYLSLKGVLEGRVAGQHNYTDYQRCVALYYNILAYDELEGADLSNVDLSLVPSLSKENISKTFDHARITVVKNEFYYLVAGDGVSIGAMYSYLSKRTVMYTSPMCLVDISGIKMNYVDGSLLCSMSRGNNFEISRVDDKLSCKGELYPAGMGKWLRERDNAKTISYKRILHILWDNAPFLNRLLFSFNRKLFKKKPESSSVEIERSITFMNDKLSVKNSIRNKNPFPVAEDGKVCETFFIPFGQYDGFEIDISKRKFRLNDILSKKVKTNGFNVYFGGNKIAGMLLEGEAEIELTVEDGNLNENKNNMKFTGGTGLIVSIPMRKLGPNESISINYEISL